MQNRSSSSSRRALEQKTEELSQANRRLTLLTSVTNSLMLADMPRDHLKAMFATVAAEIGAKYYLNYSYDEAKPGYLTLESSAGLEPSQQVDFSRIEIGRSVFGRVAASRRPLVIENVDLRDDEPTALLRKLGATAYLGLPLWRTDICSARSASLRPASPDFQKPTWTAESAGRSMRGDARPRSSAREFAQERGAIPHGSRGRPRGHLGN